MTYNLLYITLKNIYIYIKSCKIYKLRTKFYLKMLMAILISLPGGTGNE